MWLAAYLVCEASGSLSTYAAESDRTLRVLKVAFSKTQLAEFSRQLHARCERRIGDLLIACFAEAGDVPCEELDALVRSGCAKADNYGLTSERGAATFVMLSWLHGEDFDTRLEQVRCWLADGQRSSAEKVDLLSLYLAPARSCSGGAKDAR